MWSTRNTHRSLETASELTSGPKAEIRLYDSNLFKIVLLIVLLLIYIGKKFPLFIPSKDEILVKKRCQILCMRRRQDDVSGPLIFCGHPHGA